MLSKSSPINPVLVHSSEEDVKKTPNKWENLTKMQQPDVGYSHLFNESIYFIGKEAVQVYDPLTDTWELINDTGLTGDHTSGGSALFGNCIYFLYGWNSAIFYNISENRFIEFERSSILRTDIAVAELNGLIYVSGGWSSTDFTSLGLVEVYDPETNIWSEVASMNVGRKRHEMIALNGYLYAIGGELGESFTETTKSVERYSPTTNTWEIMNLPSYSYSNFGVTASDNHTFVVIHFTTEVYNTSSGNWLRGPNLFPTFRDILHPALTYYNGCVYALGGQRFIEGNDCFDSVYRWNIRTHKFVSYSRTPTINEFLNIWPRVFPTMLLFLILGTGVGILLAVMTGFSSKLVKEEILRKYIYQNGFPVKIGSFKGHIKYSSLDTLLAMWLAVFLMPIISFLPIMLYDASILLRDLWLVGLVPGFVIALPTMSRINRRFEKTKVYFYSSGMGISRLGKDFIFPNRALRKIRIDKEKKWIVLKIKYRFLPERIGNVYLAFTTLEELETCAQEIELMTKIPVEASKFTSRYYKLVAPYKNVQMIQYTELPDHILPKTFRILEEGQEELLQKHQKHLATIEIQCPQCLTTFPSKETQCPKCQYKIWIEESFSYRRYTAWVMLVSLGLSLLPLVIPGIVEWQYTDRTARLFFLLYSYVGFIGTALITEKIHYRNQLYITSPKKILLVILLGLVLILQTIFMFSWLSVLAPANVRSGQYFFINPLVSYILGGFLVYFLVLNNRIKNTPTGRLQERKGTSFDLKKRVEGEILYCPRCGENRIMRGHYCIKCGYKFPEVFEDEGQEEGN
ncbi:MAG: hypothetical protein ACW99R_12190 [Candidatus Hodarchaeales archaeon]|jgi:N-acetylneuraminic acid mutarotase